MKNLIIVSLVVANTLTTNTLLAQTSQNALQVNTITTSVPLMSVTPDSRHGALGDAGVAASPDANSNHWNAAALPFAINDVGLSVTYTPWLRALVPDINLAYLGFYKKIDDRQAIGASFRYFSLGNITFTDNVGQVIRDVKPYEMAADISYSRKLSNKISGGLTMRYIRSDLTNGVGLQNGTPTYAGNAVAADVSFYYVNPDFKVKDKNAELSFGANFSNLGTKISYTKGARKDFLPMNMRLGAGLKVKVDEHNSLTILADINKLLVPTPPKRDSVGGILAGKDPDVSVGSAIFQSFGDAPNGFKEEIKEISWALGVEYWYQQLFALRGGYFHESPIKGNRRYFTLGAGIKWKTIGIDLSYLIPTTQKHPLENTLRFGVRFDFQGAKAAANNDD